MEAFHHRAFKFLVSILVLVFVLVPLFILVGIPIFAYKTFCQLWILVWRLDLFLAPFGMDSFQSTLQEMEIRVVMEFDSRFNLDKFTKRIEEHLPTRLKYTATNFGGFAAFSKGNQTFSLKNHVRQIQMPSVKKSDGFQKKVQKIAMDLEPLSNIRPQWEFLVIPDEDKIGIRSRNAVIFRIDHAFTDVIGIYGFLTSLADENSPVEFYVDPFDRKTETTKSQPNCISVGWGFIRSLPWILMMVGNRKCNHKNANPQKLSSSVFEVDVKKIGAIKRAYHIPITHIFTAAVSKARAKVTKETKLPFSFTAGKLGRKRDEPLQNLSCLRLLTANSDTDLKTAQQSYDQEKHTFDFYILALSIFGCFMKSLSSFNNLPFDMFMVTNSPFTKRRIQIGGSQIQLFYWLPRINTPYVGFVTYDEKMICTATVPARLFSEEEVNQLSSEIQTEIENMYQSCSLELQSLTN